VSGNLSESELCHWLETHATDVAHRWSVELRARTNREDGPVESLREALLHAMARSVGPALGPWRDQVEPLLHQIAALYGNVAFLRGLAAGDVVEEVQLLREILLRFLFRDGASVDPTTPIGLRELLRLSRVVDQLVTHANVGHIDALFFNLLHGSGVSEVPGEERVAELTAELAHLQDELDQARPREERQPVLPRT
jgi:hypothetical protein